MSVQTDPKTRGVSRLEVAEPAFSENALTVLKKRYFVKDDHGFPIETASEMVWRVASNIAQGELGFAASREKYEDVCHDFYSLMASCEFLPNSPSLMNAGKGRPQQLSACFVIPVEDAIDSIFDAVKHAAIIHKTGGGTGFSFSRLRPKNDRVRSTKGVSSGPVSFMRVFNSATEAIKQGGARRGANMGILSVHHPDILEFIECKADMTSVTNFNISVAITEKFMEAVLADAEYELVNPKNSKVTSCLRAREVFDRIVENAWKNGDPGIVFIDRINRDNPTPLAGQIESTNPCGEQPLLPYEACNLGSLNLAKMVREVAAQPGSDGLPFSDEDGYPSRNPLGGATCFLVDWDKMASRVRAAIRFLDDVIEMSDFPLPAIEHMVKAGNRKIGLGVMGFADLLFMLGIPYDTREAVTLGERIMAFIQKESGAASEELAAERGAFGNFPASAFNDPAHPWFTDGRPRRNATVTTIAPTGTISIIAGCSSGIEPLFAVSFHRKVLDGAELVDTHPFFERVAHERGFYSAALMNEIAVRGTVQEVSDIPDDVRRVFITAHDVSPKWHLEHQAAFQRHCENAVSKTVNFPNSATRDEVAEVYRMAYLKGCKGVTIYRDGSRDLQVLNLGSGAKKAEEKTSTDDAGATADATQRRQQHEAPPLQRSARPVLSAGGARVAIRASAAPPQAGTQSGLRRQFSAPMDRAKLERLAGEARLFIGDGNGFRVPLNLVGPGGCERAGRPADRHRGRRLVRPGARHRLRVHMPGLPGHTRHGGGLHEVPLMRFLQVRLTGGGATHALG